MDRHTFRRDLLATLLPGFTGFTPPPWLAEAFADGLHSVCIYGENVQDAAQLRALGTQLRELSPNALIAIDEEGGDVTRLHYLEGAPYPGAAVLGRIDDLSYTEEIGARVGQDMLGSRFNLALAPIADVNSNPLNPVIGTRSFGADPALTGRHVAAWVRGIQGTGVHACAKHFPGHGDTAQDSHLAMPRVDLPREVLNARELPPFSDAVNAGVAAVMTSHILLPQVDPSTPATFSRIVLQGMLRDELEFEGVIITDALDMAGASANIGIPEAAVRALIAGCDLLCLGTGSDPELLHAIETESLRAIESGRLTVERVAEAANRVRALSALPVPAADVTPTLRTSSLKELTSIQQSFSGLDTSSTWLREHPAALVVCIDAEANMAVGAAPWGPFAAAASPLPGTRWQASAFHKRERLEAGVLPHEARRADGVLVIGRDMHRLAHARAAIDTLRAAGVPTLTIEMGWPSEDPSHGYADVSCYGSSRLVGAALLHLIEGESE